MKTPIYLEFRKHFLRYAAVFVTQLILLLQYIVLDHSFVFATLVLVLALAYPGAIYAGRAYSYFEMVYKGRHYSFRNNEGPLIETAPACLYVVTIFALVFLVATR